MILKGGKRRIVKKPRADPTRDEYLARMETLAALLRDAERLLKMYEKGMDELVHSMNGESHRRWAQKLPRVVVPAKDERKR